MEFYKGLTLMTGYSDYPVTRLSGKSAVSSSTYPLSVHKQFQGYDRTLTDIHRKNYMDNEYHSYTPGNGLQKFEYRYRPRRSRDYESCGGYNYRKRASSAPEKSNHFRNSYNSRRLEIERLITKLRRNEDQYKRMLEREYENIIKNEQKYRLYSAEYRRNLNLLYRPFDKLHVISDASRSTCSNYHRFTTDHHDRGKSSRLNNIRNGYTTKHTPSTRFSEHGANKNVSKYSTNHGRYSNSTTKGVISSKSETSKGENLHLDKNLLRHYNSGSKDENWCLDKNLLRHYNSGSKDEKLHLDKNSLFHYNSGTRTTSTHNLRCNNRSKPEGKNKDLKCWGCKILTSKIIHFGLVTKIETKNKCDEFGDPKLVVTSVWFWSRP